MQIHVALWACDIVDGLSKHVASHMLVFSIPLKMFSFIFRLVPSPHQWTDFDYL